MNSVTSSDKALTKEELMTYAMDEVTKYDMLERSGFDMLKANAGTKISKEQWIWNQMVSNTKEVEALFGKDPFDVPAYLADLWDNGKFEDGISGLRLTWEQWASFFSIDATLDIYKRIVAIMKANWECEYELAKLKHFIDELKEGASISSPADAGA